MNQQQGAQIQQQQAQINTLQAQLGDLLERFTQQQHENVGMKERLARLEGLP